LITTKTRQNIDGSFQQTKEYTLCYFWPLKRFCLFTQFNRKKRKGNNRGEKVEKEETRSKEHRDSTAKKETNEKKN